MNRIKHKIPAGQIMMSPEKKQSEVFGKIR